MDSNQKILKELSDLTRNLDVLIKEIRESNKINSENQKTTIQTLENSVQKAEEAAKKAEQTANKDQASKSPATATKTADAEKSSKEAVDKATKETQKRQDGMFSRFLKSIRKNSEEGNEVLRKASLNSLKEANENLLKTGSIKQAISAGLTAGVKGGKEGILSLGAKKAASAISERREELKNREKVVKEEEKKDEDKKFSLKDLNIFRKKDKENKEKSSESSVKKDEKKGFFEKLSEKFSKKEEENRRESKGPAKKEELKTENKTPASIMATASPSKLETLNKPLGKDGNWTDEQYKFIMEMNKGTGKQTNLMEKNSTDPFYTKKQEFSPSSKSVTNPSAIGEKKSFKERVKERIEEGAVGKKIKEAKSLLSKNKKEKDETKSEMKKEIPTLASPATATASGQTTPSAGEKKEGTTPTTSTTSTTSTPAASTTSTASTPAPATPSSSAGDKKGSGESSNITPEDIKDIKSLLTSINNALKGPLMVKDNKPFRPKSNMLE